MIDYQNIFHTGYAVHDLPAEMANLTDSLGIRWAKPYTYEALRIWTPESGLHEVRLDVAYSAVGPQRIEIMTGPAGSFYDPDRHSAHHVGVWTHDLTGDVERMIGLGWKVVVAALPPEEGCGRFAYLAPPRDGLLVEVVDFAARTRFERWWNGADSPV